MNTLINNLLLFDDLNEQQTRLISRITQQVHLQAGQYYAEPGNIISQLAFVDEGVLRYNYYNNKAENITNSFIGEGNFIALSSPLNRPFIQSDYLQAITKCALTVIGKSGMQELSATIPNWDNIVKKVSQKAIFDRRSRLIRLLKDIHPSVIADHYLKKFSNVNKHLKVDQMLQYLQNWQPK